MDKELRILILEDVPADAELEEHELRKAGLVFTSKVVDTREAFLKALDEFFPDLILSDYELPSFDGLAALRIAKEKCPDVPFILVTGKLGEEFAIEKLKEGATDYVLKGNLKRLVPSVKRALEEAKLITDRKCSEEALKKETLRRSILMDRSLDGIAILNQEHELVEANQRFAEMLGYTPKEVIGLHTWDWQAVMTEEEIRANFVDLTKINVVFETRHRRKDGTIFDVEVSASGTKVGDEPMVFSIYRDITERKQAEEEVLKTKRDWEDIFQAIGNPTIILDPEHNILSANRATNKALGADTEDEIKGKKCYEFFHNAGKPPEGCPLVKLRASLQLTNVEMEVEALGGTYLVSCTPIFDEKGNLQKVIHIATDISKRKHAEELLIESEKRYRELYEGSRDAYAMVNMEGTIIESNTFLKEILGYTDEELQKKSFKDITPSKWHAIEAKILEEQVMKRGYSDIYEKEYIRSNGTVFPIEIRTYLLRGKDGEPKAMWAFVRDITERKKSEELKHEITDQIILNKKALLELTIMQTPDLETFSKIITLMSSQVLGVERVSLWFYNSICSEIICEALYILSKNIHEKGFRLRANDYPKYFEALEEGRVLAADDARTDPRTSEFTGHYLNPLGIFSMMDIPIRRHGKVIGVMCYEDIKPRQWTQEDQNFAASVGQIITSALEDFERKKAEKALKKSEKELKKRVKELEEFYDIAIGREIRMKDLKEEIEGLKKELEKYKKQ